MNTGSCIQTSAAGMKPYKHTTLSYQSVSGLHCLTHIQYSLRQGVGEKTRAEQAEGEERELEGGMEACQEGRRQTC